MAFIFFIRVKNTSYNEVIIHYIKGVIMENEKNDNIVKKFFIDHKKGILIGACGIAAATVCFASYLNGRVDQLRYDCGQFGKQMNNVLDLLDDETRQKAVEAFNQPIEN